jgi:hypothetical protein
MGTGTSIEAKGDVVRTQETRHRHHGRRRQNDALVHGGQQVPNVSPHHQVPRIDTQRVEPATAIPKQPTAMPKQPTAMPKQPTAISKWTPATPRQASVKTADRALPGNLTKRLITGEIKRYKPTAAFAQLSRTINWRIGFHSDTDGHARVEVDGKWELDEPLVATMVGWAAEFRHIGEYDAIFALLDCLDLSMVAEFHDPAEGELSDWQRQLVDCYETLTGVWRQELARRGWINFDDLIADLKTELIIGLCNESSGYYDPVMAAKVMLRPARANPYSGELATGDLVIEALIGTGIPLDALEQVLGRSRVEGTSEAHWWWKFERRLEDPDGKVDRAKPPRLGAPENALLRFSLHRVDDYNRKREIRLHNVAPKSPIKGVMRYILQELVNALYPQSLTKIRTYERQGKFLISFGDDNVVEASAAGPRSAESMFRSFANYGIAEKMVAGFFAGHRKKGTKDLFSHGIAKLFAMRDRSRFDIAIFPDRFELVDYGVEDDEQRLERAEHLIETIRDLAWFELVPAARALLPLLRSDLQTLWDKTDGKPLDWNTLRFTELLEVLQILLELQEESARQQGDVWRRGV